MYLNGRGAPKDEKEAYKWFLLAEARGYDDATKSILDAAGIWTPQQRAEGQRRAQEWKPQIPQKVP